MAPRAGRTANPQIPKTLNSRRVQCAAGQGRGLAAVERDLERAGRRLAQLRAREEAEARAAAAPAPARRAAAVNRMGSLGTSPAVTALLSVALVGSTVTGSLAGRRRRQLEALTARMKELNLRLRTREGDLRAVLASFDAGPSSGGPGRDDDAAAAEADPMVAYLQSGKQALREGRAGDAAALLREGLGLAESAGNPEARRSALLGLAAAEQQRGDLAAALELLFKVAGASLELEEAGGSCDVYGLIADVYTEMGNYEEAGVWYDKAIAGMDADF